MSSSKEIREQAWAKQAPDYFLEGVCIMVDAREDMRAMVEQLNQRHAATASKEQKLNERSSVLDDREQALLNAVEDIKEFANKTYGPDSEMTKIVTRLERLGEVQRRVDAHDNDIIDLKNRVSLLERAS